MRVNPSARPLNPAPVPQDMLHTYAAVYFWLEVVLQFVIGIAGFIANMAVIPILCW